MTNATKTGVTVTDERLIEVMAQVVAAKGGHYAYESPYSNGICKYTTPEGEPSCIVGHVFAEIAPDAFAEIRKWEYRGGGGVVDVALGLLVKAEHAIDLSPRQVRALKRAQVHQDAGQTWGVALEQFLREMDVQS